MSFKMLPLTILSSLWFGVVLSQSPCAAGATSSTFEPVVMRYTPYMTSQIAPVSTIYDRIVTTWYNAVDCRYVTPLRVDENPTSEGPFNTFTRVSVLTITRVGCMPETTAVTRRDVRGRDQNEIATTAVAFEQKIHKRRTAQDAIDEVAADMPTTLPPDLTSLTVQAYLYLVSVNTAIFAINLIQAGVDLNQTCAQLREPASQARLFRTTIDPVQAGDIICFAANNGIYFSEPIPALITYLEDVIYAIQARSIYDAGSTAFCWSLEPINSPWLGFDLPAIAKYLCPTAANITSSAVDTFTSPTSLPTATPGIGNSSVSAPAPVSPTGGPFANSTTNGTKTMTGYGTGTAGPVATETAAPYGNSTATYVSESITSYPNSTAAGPVETSAPYANATITNPTASITTEVIQSSFTFDTSSTHDTGIIFSNATYTYASTGSGIGTGAASETGSLPAAATPVSPGIESVTPSASLRFRRW